MFGPQAHGGEDRDGFRGFGQATQEIKTFARQGGVRQAAFFGECGEGQEAAAGADEAGQEHGRGQGVVRGVGHGKAQGNRGLKHEVERDVEEARVGGLGQAGHAAVKAVEQARSQQQRQAPPPRLQRNGHGGGHADGKAQPGQRVGADACAHQAACGGVQRGAQQGLGVAVKHGWGFLRWRRAGAVRAASRPRLVRRA